MDEENPYTSNSLIDPTPLMPPALPVKEAWNGWWTLLWGFLSMMVFILVQVVAVFVVLAVMEGIPRDPDALQESLEALIQDGDAVGVIAFVSIFAVCPFCWLMGKLKSGWGGWEYLGSQKVVWWQWLVWLGVMFAVIVGFDRIAPFIGVEETPESMLQMGRSTEFPVLFILGLAVGAPFVEEFIFRGLLFRGWKDSALGLWGTLVVTSLWWTMLHVQYQPAILGFLFVLGIILGLARHYTGSLWVPVGMHALNNALAAVSILTIT